MPTTFKKPINNLTTTLGAAYAPGSGTMTVRAGDGARFGVVSASSPIRFTCVKASGVDKNGQVNPIAAISIYFATGITGDTLTGVSVAEGTTDQSFVAGDFLTMVFTAGTILDIQGAVNTLETTSGADTTAINANTASINNHIADKANPHAVTAAQVGNNIAQWNASSLLGRALDAGVPPAGGQVLVWDAVNSKWVSGGAFWDLVNKRLGIGTATPGTNLHIDGAAGGTSAAMWMTSDGAVNHFADMLFGQGTNTGQYAEFIRYNAGSDAGFLPSDFGIANLLHRIFFSTAYNAGYRIDFLIDENGLVGIGPASGLAAQLTVESKDVARPVAVFRVAAGQTEKAVKILGSDGTTVLASFGPDGTVTAPVHDNGGRGIDIRAHGAVVDGVTNDTAAVKAAQAAAGSTMPVLFPEGVCLVDDTLFSSMTGYSSFTWIGARSARGCNAGASFPASTIKFRPTDTSKWLVEAANTTAGQEATTIGPYILKDLAFDLGDANGLRFGLEDVNNDGASDTVVDGSGQAYVYGVRFDGCALVGTAANRASDANGVITRSGKKLVHLTKCFETVLSDTSFYGCDVQIRTWGCDKPTFSQCRFQGAHLPTEFHGSGTFTVQHTVHDCQFEGWTFTPILNDRVSLAVSDCRMEQNDGTPVGSGKLALTQTAAVTAGSYVVTFSSDMTGVLWPGISLVELSDGTNTLLAYVQSVSGASVTLEQSSIIVTWSAVAATATRYHGVGPIHYSVLGSTFSGIDADASTNCPAFVYVASRSTMSISGAHRAILTHSPTTSMVIGNRLIWPSPGFEDEQNLSGHMSFSSCDPFIVADSTHPHVVVDNLHSTHDGRDWSEGVRARLGRHEDDVESVARCWAFSPRSSGTYTDNSYLTPFIKIPGDANTTQFAWAWHVFDPAQPLVLEDGSLPSDGTVKLRIRLRARSVAATGSLIYAFQGNGTGAGTTVNLTDSWKTFTSIIDVPAQWVGTKTVATAIRFTGSGYYLAGVIVEELAPATDEHITGNLTVDGTITGVPTATSGSATLSAGYAIPASATWEDPGVSVTLPSAGTYLITANIRGFIVVTGGGGYLTYRLFDNTAAAVVASSERLGPLDLPGSGGQIQQQSAFSFLYTVASASAIKLQVMRNDGDGTTAWPVSRVESDSVGWTVLDFVKLS